MTKFMRALDIWSISKLPDLQMNVDLGSVSNDSPPPADTGAPTPPAGEVVHDLGSASATFNMQPGKSMGAVAFDSIVPDSYKETPWAKNLMGKPVDEFFKQHDNVQKLIGQRQQNQVPGKDATPEQVQQYRDAIGVPKAPEEYKYEPLKAEGDDAKIIEFLNSQQNPMLDYLKKGAHQLGMTPEQFQGFIRMHDQAFVSIHKQAIQEMLKVEQEMDADFDTKGKQMFGEHYTKVFDSGREMIERFVPNQLRPMLASLDNNSLLVLAGAMFNVRQTFMREDKLTTNGASSGTPPTREGMREQLRAMKEKQLNMSADSPEYAKLTQLINQGYIDLSKMK